MKKISSIKTVNWFILAALTLGSIPTIHAVETQKAKEKKALLKRLGAEWKETRTLAKKVKAKKATPAEVKELKKRRRRIIRRAIVAAIIVAFLVAIGVFAAKGKSEQGITVAEAEQLAEAAEAETTPGEGVVSGPACNSTQIAQFNTAISSQNVRGFNTILAKCSPSEETVRRALWTTIKHQRPNIQIVQTLFEKYPNSYTFTTPEKVLFQRDRLDTPKVMARASIVGEMVKRGAVMGNALYRAVSDTSLDIKKGERENTLIPRLLMIMVENSLQPDQRTIDFVKSNQETNPGMYNSFVQAWFISP